MRAFSWWLPWVLVGCATAAGDDASSTAEASLSAATLNSYFITQWGPTRFNAAGHPDGYDDCGPTSFYMAASFLHYVSLATPVTAEGDIRYARNLTHGGPTPVSTATWGNQDIAGFHALGAAAYPLAPALAGIDAVLVHGGVVLAMGDPRNAWGLVLDGRGQYLHHYDSSPDDHFGHTVVIFGRTSTGDYIIGDPLSTIGVFHAAAPYVERFFSDYGSLAEAVEVHAPGQ
jgi:hypothetical protein